MATTGYIEIIDRSILWKKAMGKKAMEKKDGTYDEVVIPMVEKIVSVHFLTYISFILRPYL